MNIVETYNEDECKCSHCIYNKHCYHVSIEDKITYTPWCTKCIYFTLFNCDDKDNKCYSCRAISFESNKCYFKLKGRGINMR